jgi:hypothetical protein
MPAPTVFLDKVHVELMENPYGLLNFHDKCHDFVTCLFTNKLLTDHTATPYYYDSHRSSYDDDNPMGGAYFI